MPVIEYIYSWGQNNRVGKFLQNWPIFCLIIGFNNCVGEGGGRDIGEKARGGRFRGKQEREVGGKKRGGGEKWGELG